jgi:hypothetical protein
MKKDDQKIVIKKQAKFETTGKLFCSEIFQDEVDVRVCCPSDTCR